MRTAKRYIAAAVRATESQRSEGDRRLFVTPAYFGPEDLGPPQDFEHILAIVPSAERWRTQFEQREGYVDERHAQEYEQWAARFGTGVRAANAGRPARMRSADRLSRTLAASGEAGGEESDGEA